MHPVALWTFRLIPSGDVDISLTSVSVNKEPGIVLGPENEVLVAFLLEWVDHESLGKRCGKSVVVLFGCRGDVVSLLSDHV